MNVETNNLPYCFGAREEFDKKTGPQLCKKCGFRRECRRAIEREYGVPYGVGRPNGFYKDD
jgi:hypothetical protein